MASLRAFFALPVTPSAQQQLAALSHRLRHKSPAALSLVPVYMDSDLHWIRPENYHLTLAFLGTIQHRDIEKLHRVSQQLVHDVWSVKPVSSTDSYMNFTSIEWFPSALKPKLIVAKPRANTQLLSLQKQLTLLLHQHGFHIEKRRFKPHVSLVRNRALLTPADLSDVTLSISSEVDELVLFRSDVSAQGVVYTPLFSEALL
jgi:2'-5' RNA ligase